MSSSVASVTLSSTPDSAASVSSTMSSQFPSFSGSFPTAPTQTGGSSSNDSNSGNNGNTSSSLYLFTFLATLLLLLAVSCAIILRSLIIRRRYQRRVQEALAAGIILPPAPHQRRRDFGEKPKLWDAHANPPESVGMGSDGWHGLMPVSVRILHDKLSGAGQKLVSTPTRPTFMQSASAHLTRAHRWRPLFFRARSHARNFTSPSPALALSPNPNLNAPGNDLLATATTTEKAVMEDAKLQVNVLIAMPSPYRPRAWEEAVVGKGKTRSSSQSENDNEEEEVPDVVFGSVDLPWKVAVEQPPSTPPVAIANTDQLQTPNFR